MSRQVWLLWALMLAFTGCRDVLGIDERKLDIAELTGGGYEGCEPADGVCDGCTSEWHSCICEGWKAKAEAQLRVDCAELAPQTIRAEAIKSAQTALEKETQGMSPFVGAFDEEFCDPPLDGDACLSCFCNDCGQSVQACAEDAGCQAIMNCFMESDCDPTEEAGAGGCGESIACGGIIRERGTLSGEAYGKFRIAVACVTEENCPCEAGPSVGMPACNAQSGCDQCGDCWGRCFCEGKDKDQCQLECGNPNCVPEKECTSCIDCMDSCLCAGIGDPAACSQMCFSTNSSQCTPANKCNCPDCFSRCACEGRSNQVCLAECSGGQTEPLCDPLDSCAGCSTCVGRCSCQGEKPFDQCLTDCGVAQCEGPPGAPDCTTCNTCVSGCGCDGGGELACRTECVTPDCRQTFSEPCDQCACDLCGFEFAACEERNGCPELMACIASTGCLNLTDCARPETCQVQVQALGGLDAPAMGLVEALQSCRNREGCGCGPSVVPPPGQSQSVDCGSRSCSAFVPPSPDPIASACCAGPVLVCGLQMASITGGGTFCAATGEPGELSTECPDYSPGIAPWRSFDVLEGCCRPDGTCGFQDFVMGLGCASVEAFGLSSPPSCEP